MRGWTAIIALAALAAVGSAYEAAWADDRLITYEVVTYDPPCMALYVEYMEAVTRLTPLRDYNRSEVVDGIPILIQVSEDRALDTVQSLLERSKVFSVQRVGPSPNGSDSVSWPVKTNPNATAGKILSNCYVNINQGLERLIRETIIREDSRASVISGAGSDPMEDRELIDVSILVSNLTSMRAYLEDNGANVLYAGSKVVKGTTLHHIDAIIPVSLVVPLAEQDDLLSMTEPSPLTDGAHGGAGGLGTTHTRGTTHHAEVDARHGAGYNGAGIGIGVIDVSFDGFQNTNDPDLPNLSNTNFRCSTTTSTIHGCIDYQRSPLSRSHGAEVAEIVMDMAPGADLFIGRVGDGYDPLDITRWMVDQGVDVIVASVPQLVLEGSGDGTSPDPESWLRATDYAVENDTIWVNSAGNYVGGQNWTTASPKIEMYNNTRWISFYDPSWFSIDPNSPGGIGNKLLKISGDINLMWYHRIDPNTDLDLYVYNGSGHKHHNSDDDQLNAARPVSAEFIKFGELPSAGGPYYVRIEVVSQTVPEYIQLIIDDGQLQRSIQNMSLDSPADGADSNMLALAAVGAAHGSDADDAKVDLVITTHNPGCTSIFLLGYDVVRQTELRPTHLYTFEEMENGLNMTFATNATVAAELVPLLADRGEISRVASYSTGPSPVLLKNDTNHNIDTNTFTGTIHLCDVLREPLLGIAVDALLADTEPVHLGDLGPAYAPNPVQHQSLIPIRLDTSNLTATLTYLKENGAVIHLALEGGEKDKAGAGSISASVHLPLLLTLHGGVEYVTDLRALMVEAVPTGNYGSIDTGQAWNKH